MTEYEDSNAYGGQTDYGQSSRPKQQDKGGLIPVTCSIINDSTVTRSETVEFQGIQILDISLVGKIIDYKEFEARVKISVFDGSGVAEINFFHSNQDSGLQNYKYDGTFKTIQIFGTVKVYKNEKSIQGSKLVLVNDMDLFYHRLNVYHSWLYLTGNLQELKEKNFNDVTNQARQLAGGNQQQNYQNNNNAQCNGINEYRVAVKNLKRKSGNNIVETDQLKKELLRFGAGRFDKILIELIDNNVIIDNENGTYEILE